MELALAKRKIHCRNFQLWQRVANKICASMMETLLHVAAFFLFGENDSLVQFVCLLRFCFLIVSLLFFFLLFFAAIVAGMGLVLVNFSLRFGYWWRRRRLTKRALRIIFCDVSATPIVWLFIIYHYFVRTSYIFDVCRLFSEPKQQQHENRWRTEWESETHYKIDDLRRDSA